MPERTSSSPVSDAYAGSVTVRRVLATDSERIRMLRLEALGDPAAGIAFLETREHAAGRPPEFWIDRAVGGALSDTSAQFIAEVGRSWVGTVTVLVPASGGADYFARPADAQRALAVAVYVSPSQRGRGVVDALFDAAADWATDRGCVELALDVHEDNLRAQAAYMRIGFRPTGVTVESPNGTEQVMVMGLGRG